MMSSRTDLLDFLDTASAELVNEISGPLCVRCGGENRAAVVLQNFQPVGNVGGMIFAGLQRNLQVGTEKSCTQLSDQFFLRIGVAAETMAAKVAVKTFRPAHPVRQFMTEG